MRKNYVGLRFRMTLHERDRDLLESVKDFFNCGKIGTGRKIKGIVMNIQWDFDSINNKIRPFFDKYQLRGTKYLDYLDWLSAGSIKIMEIKLHLKEEGFSKILSIKDKMNQNRNHFQDYQPPHTIIQNNI